MAIEKTQIKFALSPQSGEIIGFVSRHSRTKKLKGVRENSQYGKKICVLSEDLKGTVLPNVLYQVELKPMHNDNGYVVVSARMVRFVPVIETVIIKHKKYQVIITFGHKTIYYDPINGKSNSSKTVQGVIDILTKRRDISNTEETIEKFTASAAELNNRMIADGFIPKPIWNEFE